MFQQRRFSGGMARPVQPLIAHNLARQKISSCEKQEECHEHWSIERDAPQTGAKHRLPRFARMASLVIINRPLVIEAKAQVRQQFVDRGFVLEMKDGLSLPRDEVGRPRKHGSLIEIEVGHYRGKISHVIARGPETADMPRSTVGMRRYQCPPSPAAPKPSHPERRYALECPQTIIVRPLDPDCPRWDVDQVQTSAQPFTLGVCKLRGAAHELTGEDIAQRAFADMAAEALGGRQQTTIIQLDPNGAPLGDTVYESHTGWRNAQHFKFHRGSAQRLAIDVFYNFLPSHPAVTTTPS
jgi:hypothetical protein